VCKAMCVWKEEELTDVMAHALVEVSPAQTYVIN